MSLMSSRQVRGLTYALPQEQKVCDNDGRALPQCTQGEATAMMTFSTVEDILCVHNGQSCGATVHKRPIPNSVGFRSRAATGIATLARRWPSLEARELKKTPPPPPSPCYRRALMRHARPRRVHTVLCEHTRVVRHVSY